MLNSKVFTVLLVAVTCLQYCIYCKVVRSRYEETQTYKDNPWCMPSNLDKGIQCSAVTDPIEVKGDLYANIGFHYIPLASAYYVARMADAFGYQECCPTNTTFLQELDILTPFSGLYGAVALHGTCGFDKNILSRCDFPTAEYPFLCYGSDGSPGANLRWTLFIHCWRAKAPTNPRSEEIATSFNVFNLDPVLTPEDRALVIDELNRRGFNTDPSNLIEFDYTSANCH